MPQKKNKKRKTKNRTKKEKTITIRTWRKKRKGWRRKNSKWNFTRWTRTNRGTRLMKFEVMVTVLALYPLILGGAIWLFGKYSKKPE